MTLQHLQPAPKPLACQQPPTSPKPSLLSRKQSAPFTVQPPGQAEAWGYHGIFLAMSSTSHSEHALNLTSKARDRPPPSQYILCCMAMLLSQEIVIQNVHTGIGLDNDSPPPPPRHQEGAPGSLLRRRISPTFVPQVGGGLFCPPPSSGLCLFRCLHVLGFSGYHLQIINLFSV